MRLPAAARGAVSRAGLSRGAVASSCPGRLGPVKEQVVGQLSAGDRAALQGLIPLAGALGAGTIFALFFGGRRRGSGVAVFELCAIVAVLASVGMTAYLAISLLHQDMAISDRDLTQTAMPLIFAVILLVLVSAVARLPGSLERILLVLPLGLMAGLVAAWFAISSWSFSPEDAMLTALLARGPDPGRVTHYLWSLVRTRSARFWIFEPAADEEIQKRELTANDDGLFDVTGLGIV